MSQMHHLCNGELWSHQIGIPLRSSGTILQVHQKPPPATLHGCVSLLEEGQLTQVTVLSSENHNLANAWHKR